MTSTDEASSGKVVILAAYHRDAELTQSVLSSCEIACELCSSGSELVNTLREAPAVVVISEEALDGPHIDALAGVLEEQPAWSDIPFIILTSGGHSTELTIGRFGAMERLGNITILERPVRKLTLIAAVRVGLRARRRQHEIRNHLNSLAKQAAELARSNADLQQFGYVTSHDLREPLRTVSSFSQLLAKRYAGKLDAEAEQWIRFIIGGVHRMEELIHDLLTYSRLSGETRARLPVDVARVLERALEDLAQAIAESAAHIQVGPLPTILADEVELLQLFENLFSNAIKYQRPGIRPCVAVSAQRQDSNWMFCVHDNGIGFDPKYADRIFDLFKRLHGSEVPGTGIGLTLCRKIVERNGGRIWAESEPNRGSKFCFTWPIHEGAEPV